jgi:hypothetical protein
VPSYARWRRSKIVASPTINRAEELIGGLKNALERGETLSKAKQSFLNAGYSQVEIQLAVQKMPVANQKIIKPLNPQLPVQPSPSVQTPQRFTKKHFIILLIIGMIILITALTIGLFWNKIF